MNSTDTPDTRPGPANQTPAQTSSAPASITDRILSTGGKVSRFDRWVEFGSAVVLALATVLTAWCGYQAARWSGEQAAAYSQAGAVRTRAAQASNQAMLRISTQVGLFTEYVAALSEDNQDLANFLYSRFSPELRAATDAWLQTEPFTNADAPRSPFDMPGYQVPEQAEAAQLEQDAGVKAQQANDANELADRYVLLTVLFATALFFCGISGKFQWHVIDAVMLAFGTIILFTGLIVMLTLPVK
jgi:hypothetical protein